MNPQMFENNITSFLDIIFEGWGGGVPACLSAFGVSQRSDLKFFRSLQKTWCKSVCVCVCVCVSVCVCVYSERERQVRKKK